MKFTLSWLKDHLDTDATPQEIADRLTGLGLELEELIDPGAALGDFVVGHVVEAGQHPDADRLRLCKVDAGGGEMLQIVCGAPNARTGIKVALAKPGVVIPATGQALKVGKIRGVESRGMMCSARELLLGEDHDGIIELTETAETGAPLTSALSVDPVFDIAVTPNRPDALGVRGIARDLAASGLGTLKPDPLRPVAGSFKSSIDVQLDFTPETASACPMFVGRFIRGVKNVESPAWVKDRLTAIGLRPISALVDVTNYVSIDRCRPLHVFDAAKIQGPITPRLGREGESLLALDEKTYASGPSVCVIADATGPQALGGVMGGLDSGCTEETTDVFLESAYFDPGLTAATGRALAIESDAKHRFERGIDPKSCIEGAEMGTAMILELCGGEASDLVIVGAPPADPDPITLRTEQVARIGGVEIPSAIMKQFLQALGCEVLSEDTAEAGDRLTVAPPSWRVDLRAEHDLVEEVIRLHGLDNVAAVPLPRASMPTAVLTPAQIRAGMVRRTLATRGMMEAVTWSFLPRAQAELFGGGQDALILVNPISSDLDAMRPSVLPNLITAAGRNAARGFADVSLFEIGPQFFGGEPGEQDLVAAGIRAGKAVSRTWTGPLRPVDLFDAKADLLAALEVAGAPTDRLRVSTDAPGWYHPGRSGVLKLGKAVLGRFGEVHPATLAALDVKGPVVAFEIMLDALPQPKAKATKARALLSLSAFQPLERDFAFVVDRAVAADDLVRAAKGADKALIVDVAVFDLYEGDKLPEGQKSLAVSVTLQPTEQTLTDAEIEALSAKVVAAVEKATGGVLRS